MGDISEKADQAARRADDSAWMEHGARLGLIAYGVVHLLVAFLMVQLATGDKSEKVSTSGALAELAQQPFGTVWMWLCVVGLGLLTVWQALEAVVGDPDEDDPMKAWAKRAASIGKAAVYAVLAFSAAKILLSSGGGGGGGGGEETMTAKVMSWPAGQVLVVLIGLGIIGFGGFKIYQGLNEEHADKLSSEGRTGTSGRTYLLFGKIGFIAKGLAFLGIGGLFCWAGFTHDADKSGGLDQALGKLLQQPFGPVLVIAIAVGFACFGLFSLARARHLSRD